MAVPVTAASGLRLDQLHGCVRDPLLDSMTFLNEVAVRYPSAISFAPGRPNEALFEPDRIAEYLDTYTSYLRRELGHTPERIRTDMFQYGRTKGQISHLVARTVANDEAIHVDPEAVVVTVGCQEGMLLVLRTLFAAPDDVLLVGSPCYVGVTGAARLLDIDVAPVRECRDGVEPQALAAAARAARAAGKRPRAVYLVPDFANPSGARLTLRARQGILAVAEHEDLYVLEDNPYGFFVREGAPLPTLKAIDTASRVIYLGSFAKTCFPGARVGYVIADQKVTGPNGYTSLLADELAKVKSMTTINTPAVSQALIGGILLAHGCRLRDANAAAIELYRTNLTTLLGELDRQLGHRPGLRWNAPDGGFFVVVNVPFHADDRALTRSAERYGVLWTPMSHFFPDGGGARQLRLACSALTVPEIRAGVRRLAAFIADHPASDEDRTTR